MIELFIVPLGMAWFLLWAWKGATLLPDPEDPEYEQYQGTKDWA